jgi:PhnB protein
MQSRLNPYISFKDNAREAMDFYKTIFGGELQQMTFKDLHASDDPAEENKIMHSQLEAENGMILMAADTPNRLEHKPGNNITISLSGDNEAELRGYYEKLSEGGTIGEPLEKAPWGDTYGDVTDKFGIHWMVNISGPKE